MNKVSFITIVGLICWSCFTSSAFAKCKDLTVKGANQKLFWFLKNGDGVKVAISTCTTSATGILLCFAYKAIGGGQFTTDFSTIVGINAPTDILVNFLDDSSVHIAEGVYAKDQLSQGVVHIGQGFSCK